MSLSSLMLAETQERTTNLSDFSSLFLNVTVTATPRRSIAPLVFGEILVGSNQPEHLTPWSLEVKVGVWYIEDPDAERDDLLPHLFDVVGLQLQKYRLQEVSVTQGILRAVGRSPVGAPPVTPCVDECDEEVVTNSEIVFVVELPHVSAAENIAVKCLDSCPFSPPYPDSRMVTEKRLIQSVSLCRGPVHDIAPIRFGAWIGPRRLEYVAPRKGGSNKFGGIRMDSLITAARQALAWTM